LVVGVARLLFTGTIQLPISPASSAAGATLTGTGPQTGGGSPQAVAPSPAAVAAATGSAVLVVGGWGSSCCDAANGLRAALDGVPVRQFSYLGLNAKGKAIPSGASADELPLPELGARLAGKLPARGKAARRPVAVVAESEGTRGVYAMLARHPGLPVSAVVLLSPIVGPGQLNHPPGPDGASASEAALNELNHLVGGMSPYGPSGAQNLLSSVSEFGARYFEDLVGAAGGGDGGKPIRWLAVIPRADFVPLPECGLSPGAIA